MQVCLLQILICNLQALFFNVKYSVHCNVGCATNLWVFPYVERLQCYRQAFVIFIDFNSIYRRTCLWFVMYQATETAFSHLLLSICVATLILECWSNFTFVSKLLKFFSNLFLRYEFNCCVIAYTVHLLRSIFLCLAY